MLLTLSQGRNIAEGLRLLLLDLCWGFIDLIVDLQGLVRVHHCLLDRGLSIVRAVVVVRQEWVAFCELTHFLFRESIQVQGGDISFSECVLGIEGLSTAWMPCVVIIFDPHRWLNVGKIGRAHV